MATQFVDEDFVAVYAEAESRARRIVTLVFGDPVEVHESQDGFTRVTVLSYFQGPFDGFVRGTPRVRDSGVLKLSMVDVQQGDGLVLETPKGKVFLIDGGDNKLFARHLAARFRHRRTSDAAPLEIDGILVTHGDADHFDGLNDLRRSETLPASHAHKRLFIHPRRVYHNGLVKRPSKDATGHRVPDRGLFGRTVDKDGRPHVVDLFDDPRAARAGGLNRPFQFWAESLDHWERRGPITIRRIAHGMDAASLFDFLEEDGVHVELQGPFTVDVEDPVATVPSLPFFHEPPKTPEVHLERGGHPGSPSASHTINGHSVALRLTFGNVRVDLTGDLNQESMALMRERLPLDQLEAEIVKVPHHGSADFDLEAIRRMRPIVALISSGDESAAKEYIHPRATLLAALGMSMRGDTGIILNTELAAFFELRDECYRREDLAAFFAAHADRTFTGEELRALFTGVPRPEDPPGRFVGFERTNFGIIHLRTNGERVLVFTHSGKEGLNEAYRFHVTAEGAERRVAFRTVETR